MTNQLDATDRSEPESNIPLGGVLLKAELHDVLEVAAKLVAAAIVVVRAQRRRVLLQRQQQNLHGLEARVRRIALGQLQSRDTKRPDIGFVVVATHLLHNLGRHPARRAHERLSVLASVAAFHHPARDAEICDHDMAFAVQQDVAGLDVAVTTTQRNMISPSP